MQALLSEGLPVTAWRWDEYELRPAQRLLLRGGQRLAVEDRVFDLLLLLLQHRERALDRQELIAAIWDKRPVSDATLRQLVYKARHAIGDDGEHQSTIRTLYGRSLQWVAPVVAEAVDAVPAVDASRSEERRAASSAADASGWNPDGADRRKLPDRRRTNADGNTALAVPARRKTDVVIPAAPVRRRRAGWLAAALVVLACAGAATWVVRGARRRSAEGATPAAPPPDVATLAVLPFVDLDPQQDQRYVSDGLTEELINRLARMPHLRVTARTSSFMFRDKAVDVREVARRLGVANVLEGSVQRAGNRWRMRVALVDARNGYELWSREYDTGADDVLGMEDRIAGSVVATLYPKLAPAAIARLARPPVPAAAHDFYLVGLQYLGRGDFGDINKAIAYFEWAIQAAPDYVEAWNGVAAGFAMLRDYNPDEHPDTHYGEALAAVNKALTLDPQSPAAHALRGVLYMRHWQWTQAAAEYRHALQLDPNDAAAHQWYALYFWYTGDMQAALAQVRIAHVLDPLSPIINADLSRALLFAGDVDGAIRQGHAAIALAPNFELAHLFLGEAWERKGRLADAMRETRAGIALLPPPPESDDVSSLGRMEWAAGDHADALRLRDLLLARAQQHYVSGVALAYIDWAVGDKDRAFADLDRAVADHDSLLMTVSGVRYREWCSDPRFARLLASMNLPAH